MKLSLSFYLFRAFIFVLFLLNFFFRFSRRFAKMRKFTRVKIVFHTTNIMQSTKGTKEQIRGNRVLFQYLITNVDLVHKCCFFLSNLQKDYELKIYVFLLCFFLLVPSTNSRDQRHGSSTASQKKEEKTAFARTHNYQARIGEEGEQQEELWDTFLLPFNNLN